MVGLGGLEPPTSRLSSARSNQLSYKPELSSARKGSPPSMIWKKERRRRRRPANAAFDFGRVILKRLTRHIDLNERMAKPSVLRPLSSVLRSRKEVIQPQVPLRLPCYDFTPVADPTVVACLLLG